MCDDNPQSELLALEEIQEKNKEFYEVQKKIK